MYKRLNNQFDPLDIEIMEWLTQDARTPFAQIAQQLRVSNSLVHQRVKKLKASGVLKDPVFQVSPGKLGYETCAFTQIMLEEAHYLDEVLGALARIPEIVECVNIAGRYAVMVKIYAVNNRHLRDIIYEKILSISGVQETNTIVSFETAFLRGVPLTLDPPAS